MKGKGLQLAARLDDLRLNCGNEGVNGLETTIRR